ncbi:MAG: hypothetical protein QOE70_2876 [Chthoniobacter sp.]|jgi:tetratricopeptide (TPR) repeat protein|nr:hypothetical protein [Chthoniobacter sp.]
MTKALSVATFPARLRAAAANGYVWIFVFGLGLRFLYLAEAFRRNELIAYPLVDAHVYVDWARDILAGKWLWFDAMHYTPGFPVWLAGWIALLGWRPGAHFAVFHLLGAAQAVLLGKTAERLWGRRTPGLATGWLGATYWPLIVFEATYYAEAFAILNLSIALFLAANWSRNLAGLRLLVWAGFCLGCSILARANALLCAPVLAGWAALQTIRRARSARLARSAAAALALLIPPLLLCLPVLFWNWKLTGQPMLRTGGWLSVYLGNNPDYRGLVVPVGVRWTDFVYHPIRAGHIATLEQEDFWKKEVGRVLRERRSEWQRLMARKALMLTGRFEISQEIDLGIFRAASRILSLPIWPGWGVLAPLALLTMVAMLRVREARRGWLLVLCAAAYCASIVPVQVSARYRLPVVVPLLPLAGWALIYLAEIVRRREGRALAGATLVLGAAALAIWPDWLGLRQEKIINHSLLVGLKRLESGDAAGALSAFAAGAEWNPNDADCPLRMGRIWLDRGDAAKAEAFFKTAQENFPPGHDAVLGLGECALALGKPAETLGRAAEALKIAPNNMDALDLAARAYAEAGDWNAMARVCQQMRSYPTHPASVAFTEAWALIRAGRPEDALRLCEMISLAPRFGTAAQARANFLAGALVWRITHDKAQAALRWKPLLNEAGSFFQPLGALLTGEATPQAAQGLLPKSMQGRSAQYVEYALGMEASMNHRGEEAQRHFQAVVSAQNAAARPLSKQDILEIWALEDLQQSSPPQTPGTPAKQ